MSGRAQALSAQELERCAVTAEQLTASVTDPELRKVAYWMLLRELLDNEWNDDREAPP